MACFDPSQVEIISVDKLRDGRRVVGAALTSHGLTDYIYLVTCVIIDRDDGTATVELVMPDNTRRDVEMRLDHTIPVLRRN